MTGTYSITRETARNRVIIVYQGPRDYPLEEFWEEFKEAVHFAKCAKPYFDTLVDHTQSTVLPHDRSKKGQEMAVWCRENGLRRSANVVPSAVMRMQMQRITGRGEEFAFFDTREEAEAWLDRR